MAHNFGVCRCVYPYTEISDEYKDFMVYSCPIFQHTPFLNLKSFKENIQTQKSYCFTKKRQGLNFSCFFIVGEGLTFLNLTNLTLYLNYILAI